MIMAYIRVLDILGISHDQFYRFFGGFSPEILISLLVQGS